MTETQASAGGAHRPGAAPRANKWKVLVCVVFGIFMTILDTTVVNVAFPTLRREYHATLANAQWIVSVYVLALGIATPLAGFLADRFGIKRMYALGLGIFVLGSLLCGVAPSLPVLIATRALQALGGGIALPLGTAQLYAAFPPEERGTALGLFGMALLVAPALGPVLGGALVDRGLWRWIFFVNVPIGVLGVVLATRWLAPDRRARRPRLDLGGLVSAIIGFGALLYAATQADARGWTAAPTLIWFGIGGGAMIALALFELKLARDPLLDFSLFGNRIFLAACLVGWVSVLALFGAEFLLPLYLQALRGQTAFHTGIILLPLAVTAGITTPLAGRLYDRIGPRALVVFGYLILVYNTWELAHLTATTTMGYVAFLMLLRGLALGTTVQSTFTTALGAVPIARVARGSSLVNATRNVIQAVGVAVLATLLAGPLAPQVRAADHARQVRATAEPPGLCVAGAPRTGTAAPTAGAARTSPAPRMPEGAASCAEHLAGFSDAYMLTFIMSIVALLLGLSLPGWPGPWSGRTGLVAEEG